MNKTTKRTKKSTKIHKQPVWLCRFTVIQVMVALRAKQEGNSTLSLFLFFLFFCFGFCEDYSPLKQEASSVLKVDSQCI